VSEAVAIDLGPHVRGVAFADDPDWPADPPNAYCVAGERAWLVFDSGWGRPGDDDALAAMLDAFAPAGAPFGLVASHAHRDHVGGLPALARRYGLGLYLLEAERESARRHAPRLAFTPLPADRALDLGGGVSFVPVPAPGHTAGSLCALVRGPGGDVLLTGDTVVGRHSSWVGPPDGNLDAYLDTLARLADRAGPYAGARLAPGHGPAGAPAGEAAEALRLRRLGRDEDILRLLPQAPSPRALVAALYGGPQDNRILGPAGVAERTVLAHLERLCRLGRALPGASPGPDADPYLRPYRPA